MSGDEDGEDEKHDELQRTVKTKAQQNAVHRKKVGNQGHFKSDQLKLLGTFVEAYIQIPKGTQGKNSCLAQIWNLVVRPSGRASLEKKFGKGWTKIVRL